jgi:hypothetical protein
MVGRELQPVEGQQGNDQPEPDQIDEHDEKHQRHAG